MPKVSGKIQTSAGVESHALDKPIFIIGLPRSGSTLLHNLLAMDKGLFRLAEMHYLTPWKRDFRAFRKQFGKLDSKENIRRMVDSMFSLDAQRVGLGGPFWRFENICAPEEEAFRDALVARILDSDRSLGDIFRAILEELTRYSGYDRFCLKFPVYPNYLHRLISWYPRCRIVHLIRDPRAIAISKTSDPGGSEILLAKYPFLKLFYRKLIMGFVACQYVWTSFLHQKFRKLPNYLLLRYEDMLACPRETIQELCRFVEIPYTPRLLRLEKGVHDHQPSSLTGRRRRRLDIAAASRWKEHITPFEYFVLTRLTNSSMKRFEFHPSVHPVYRSQAGKR